MTFEEVMAELESLGKERMKKIYMGNGAKEPLFGVATGAMKPMRKIIKKDQELADKLYATGNYDAMYFAGVIADPNAMTEEDYERWIDGAYFYMLSDYVVAVTLSEADIAQQIADKWIDSGEDLKMSAGWNCYSWLLGHKKDDAFDTEKLSKMLDRAEEEIHTAPDRTKVGIGNFIQCVAISYIDLHDKATTVAKSVGVVPFNREHKPTGEVKPLETIEKAIEKNRIGFKRKYVRC